MGMTIEEIIVKEIEEAEWFQKLANEDIASEHYDELKIFREKHADYHNQIANILRKYQKIEQIFKDIEECELVEDYALDEIKEVVGDGNDD